MSKYFTLTDETIEEFKEILSKKALPNDLGDSFLYIGNNKQKQLIKIAKISDDITFVTGMTLKVTINEELLNQFDDEMITILYEQEIEKIEVNLESGAVKLARPNFNTFPSIVEKYGIEKVSRANQVLVLTVEQTQDKEESFII